MRRWGSGIEGSIRPGERRSLGSVDRPGSRPQEGGLPVDGYRQMGVRRNSKKIRSRCAENRHKQRRHSRNVVLLEIVWVDFSVLAECR